MHPTIDYVSLDPADTNYLVSSLRKLADEIETGQRPVPRVPCVLTSGHPTDEIEICLLTRSRVAASEYASALLSQLTRKQHLVLNGMIDGQPAKVIANDLGISRRTVEKHVAAIHHKTGTHRSFQLLALAASRLF